MYSVDKMEMCIIWLHYTGSSHVVMSITNVVVSKKKGLIKKNKTIRQLT